MKTITTNRMARFAGLITSLALFAGAISTLNAGEIFTGKGGATKLLELNKRHITPPAAVSDSKPMSCAKCRNTTVTVRDTEPKGLGARALMAGRPPTKVVARHGCEGCGNTWVVSGHGKAKTSAAVHTCTSCGAESLACCSTSKNAITTNTGMEKKFEVAPVK